MGTDSSLLLQLAGGEPVGEDDSGYYGDDRYGRRDHSETNTGNNYGGRACCAAFGKFLGGFIRLRGVVFGRTANHYAYKEADNHRAADPLPVVKT